MTETTTGSITAAMHMELIDLDGRTTPLESSFEFSPADPYAVSITFYTEIPTRWTFSRDLLVEGLYGPSGDGDLHVFPCLSTDGSAVVVLDLQGPDGEVFIQTGSRAVAEFVRRMFTEVPAGAESALIDFDAELTALLHNAGA